MEFIQDYIMRMIHDLVRLALKLLFNIDEEKAKEIIEENEEQTQLYNKLKDLIDLGNINQAENLLYDSADSDSGLMVGILIYDYMNQLDDEYLQKCNFSRQEIRDGLEDFVKEYGHCDLNSML